MASVEKSVLVPFGALTMFELVNRVEMYPEFLPWCGGAQTLTREDSITTARIDIDYRGVRQSFVTRNRMQEGVSLHMELVSGPFESLTGDWVFHALSEGACKVEFRLDYAFSSRVLEKLVGPVFDYIATTLVDSFVQRAEAIGARPS
jgi:ribosome-associated toxin RatA of RatAB toxin-antitoxin module